MSNLVTNRDEFMSSLGTVSKQLSSDDEEFFDADELGSIKQFISLDDSFEESQEKFKAIEERRIQFDKIKKREDSLINAREIVTVKPVFFIQSPIEKVAATLSTEVGNSRNADYVRSISNRKCREDLLELRNLNSLVEYQETKGRLTLQKHFKHRQTLNWNKQSQDLLSVPIHNPSLIYDEADSFSDTSSTSYSSHAFCDVIAGSSHTLDRNATPSNPAPDHHDHHSTITYDEFINPVDKQIAACMFQMSSVNSSMLESTTSEIDDSNSGKPDLKENHEEDNSESGQDFETIENQECSKKKHCTSESASMNSTVSSESKQPISEQTRQSSFGAKTREGFKNVLSKFSRVVKNVQSRAGHKVDHVSCDSESDGELFSNANQNIKYKAARSNKGSHDFANAQVVQVLHSNPASTTTTQENPSPSVQHSKSPTSNCIIWAMKFSPCGKLLASAGKDHLIRVWVLRTEHSKFYEIIKKHAPTNATESQQKRHAFSATDVDSAPFHSKPLVIFSGHTSDILDLSWSKNLFLLSASSDKTCRLWHTYKAYCLCTFYHNSIVSAISFHPKDERYFMSACLDGKLRLWNMAEKRVVLWNELNSGGPADRNFITALSFCQSGKTIAVGTFDGKCVLYHTEHLKYYSLLNVKSSKGRSGQGTKITGIEVLNNDENKILVTSNDSRIRLYDLRDLSLVCKYRGFSNSTVHISASLSPNDAYVICGSKDKCIYLWRTNYNFSGLHSAPRRDRNSYWERLQAHNAVVTCAIFSPKPLVCHKSSPKNEIHMFVSAAGCDGAIKVFTNRI